MMMNTVMSLYQSNAFQLFEYDVDQHHTFLKNQRVSDRSYEPHIDCEKDKLDNLFISLTRSFKDHYNEQQASSI